MRKLIAITLTLCMVFSLVVMPVSAGTMIEKQLTPTGAGITSNDIAANAANVGENVIDGDAETMAIVDGYGRGVYVDLGAEYDLTSLSIVLPSADEITAFVADNGIALAESVSAVNTGAQIRVGGNSYGSYVTSNSTLSGGAVSTRLNTSSQNIGKGKTITYTNLSAVRYIVVSPTAGSTPIAVTDIVVRGMVEVGATQTVNKQIEPVTAGYGNNNLENSTTNKATNVIDGDTSTMTLVDGSSSSYLFVDLGAEYDLTKIEVVLPTSNDVTNFIAANGFSTDAASKYNTACTIWAGSAPSAQTARINADGSGIGLGRTKTYTDSSSWAVGLAGENTYRYIVFYSGGASYPFAISEVRVYGYVIEEVVYEADVTSVKAQYGVEAKANLAADATVTMYHTSSNAVFTPAAAYSGSKMFDNDESTFAHIQRQYSTSPASGNWAVIDLGSVKNIGSVEVSVPTIDEIANALTYSNTAAYPASNVNTAVSVALTNEVPVLSDYTDGNGVTTINPAKGYQINGGGSITSGVNWTNKTGNTLSYRYVVIYAPGSYGASVSELKVYDDAPQNEKLRFIFQADYTMEYLDSFGAYVIPFDLFDGDVETSIDAENIENSITAELTSGGLFAVDVTDIPAEAYDVDILAVPYVSFGGEYYYGDGMVTTVNSILATQAQ